MQILYYNLTSNVTRKMPWRHGVIQSMEYMLMTLPMNGYKGSGQNTTRTFLLWHFVV